MRCHHLLLYVVVGLLLASCVEQPQRRVEALAEGFVAGETTVVTAERLRVRYQRALDYVRRRTDPYSAEDGCPFVAHDTLRQEPLRLLVGHRPIPVSHSFTKWSENPSVHSYTDAFAHLLAQVNDAVTAVTDWQARHEDELSSLAREALRALPSDSAAEVAALFEVPSGRTVTVQTVWLPSGRDTLLHSPAEALHHTPGGAVFYFEFDDSDEIERVFSGPWEHLYGG